MRLRVDGREKAKFSILFVLCAHMLETLSSCLIRGNGSSVSHSDLRGMMVLFLGVRSWN